jgi:hypothetical protein
MSNTSNLALPYLAVGQAQKHVTVNESLRKLDAIIQLSVVSATTAAEPSTPTDGAVYIIPSGKSGTHWSAFANGSLGYYRDGAWVEIAPREGWLAFVKDTDQLLVYSGSAWSLFPAANLLAVSATDKLIGRSSSGAGAAEEIACTAAGRALIDDANAAAQRTTLGLSSMAIQGASSVAITGGSIINIAALSLVTAGANLIVQSPSGAGPKLELETPGRYDAVQLNSGGMDFIYDVTGAAKAMRWSGSALSVPGKVQPSTDNAQHCGDPSFRWDVVYSVTGTINTSDARDKTELRALNDAERRAIRRVFAGAGVFQWRDALAAKGEAARLHAGLTAQSVAEAFRAEGLDPERYALFCADPLEEEAEGEETVRLQRPVREPGADAKASTEEVEVTRPIRVRRTVLDDKGDPVMRLGLRYDQLFAMAIAALV